MRDDIPPVDLGWMGCQCLHRAVNPSDSNTNHFNSVLRLCLFNVGESCGLARQEAHNPRWMDSFHFNSIYALSSLSRENKYCLNVHLLWFYTPQFVPLSSVYTKKFLFVPWCILTMKCFKIVFFFFVIFSVIPSTASTLDRSMSKTPCLHEEELAERRASLLSAAASQVDNSKGVFRMKMKNTFVPIERVFSVNTYSWI